MKNKDLVELHVIKGIIVVPMANKKGITTGTIELKLKDVFIKVPKKSLKGYVESTKIKETKEVKDSEVGSVERPTGEEIAIEKDPRKKAEFEDTEKLMKKAEKKK